MLPLLMLIYNFRTDISDYFYLILPLSETTIKL
jgi:hypothetical protein